MRERRLNPVGRAATAGVTRITLGGLRLAVLDLEQTANFMIDMVFPQRRPSPSALSDLGQWRGAGALFDRTHDRPAVPRRRPHQCRRPAARHRVAVQIDDAAARARRDHRPVSRRRPQGADGRLDLLHVRRGRGGERRRRRQRSQTISRPQDRRTFPRLSPGRRAARQGRRNQRAGAGLSLGLARRSL